MAFMLIKRFNVIWLGLVMCLSIKTIKCWLLLCWYDQNKSSSEFHGQKLTFLLNFLNSNRDQIFHSIFIHNFVVSINLRSLVLFENEKSFNRTEVKFVYLYPSQYSYKTPRDFYIAVLITKILHHTRRSIIKYEYSEVISLYFLFYTKNWKTIVWFLLCKTYVRKKRLKTK